MYSSVPVSRLPKLVYETTKELTAPPGIVLTIVGHIGDGGHLFIPYRLISRLVGNLHDLLLFRDERNTRLQVRRFTTLNMVKRAISSDGTFELLFCHLYLVPLNRWFALCSHFLRDQRAWWLHWQARLSLRGNGGRHCGTDEG